jgi:hypothetical protein
MDGFALAATPATAAAPTPATKPRANATFAAQLEVPPQQRRAISVGVAAGSTRRAVDDIER